MTLRILLVESDGESALFLREVLEETVSGAYWSEWVQLDTFDAPSWTVADAVLAKEPIDVILLNLSSPSGVEAFRSAQVSAPHVPVVLLAQDSDLNLAERLVREGAQDFLLHKYVDCLPLAHAIRTAIYRQRALTAARADAMRDPLTGFLNRTTFQLFAERDQHLAERLGRRMAVVLAEPCVLGSIALPHDAQEDLALMEVADQLRSIARTSDLLARIDANRFALSLLESEEQALETEVQRFERGAGWKLITGSAVFDPQSPATLDQLLDQASQRLADAWAAARANRNGSGAGALSGIAATAAQS
jgi:PleD family two-component response regulator